MKTALVTGASRGLGFGFVQNLLDQGFEVFATYHSLEKGEPLTDFKHPKLHKLEMNVSDDGSIQKACEQVSAKAEKLDLLVNNAGINHDSPGMHKPKTTQLGNLQRKELVEMFEINTISAILVTQAFLPLLKGSKIINISSYRASFTHRDEDKNFNNYGYASSKVALNMMTRDLAHDLEPYNAVVYAIDPGSVHSSMNKTGKQEPAEASAKILETVSKLTAEQSGKYLDNRGNLAEL